MNAATVDLGVFAVLSLATLAAAGVATLGSRPSRQVAGLAGLGAGLAAILAGYLGSAVVAAAVLLAEVAMAGLVLAVAARWGWGDYCESASGRLGAGVAIAAVVAATAALGVVLASLEAFTAPPPAMAASSGVVGRHLAGTRLLPFLLTALLLLTGIAGLVVTRQRLVAGEKGATPSGGGESV